MRAGEEVSHRQLFQLNPYREKRLDLREVELRAPSDSSDSLIKVLTNCKCITILAYHHLLREVTMFR